MDILEQMQLGIPTQQYREEEVMFPPFIPGSLLEKACYKFDYNNLVELKRRTLRLNRFAGARTCVFNKFVASKFQNAKASRDLSLWWPLLLQQLVVLIR